MIGIRSVVMEHLEHGRVMFGPTMQTLDNMHLHMDIWFEDGCSTYAEMSRHVYLMEPQPHDAFVEFAKERVAAHTHEHHPRIIDSEAGWSTCAYDWLHTEAQSMGREMQVRDIRMIRMYRVNQ